MPAGVKIELGRGGSGIFLEDSDGVADEGGNADLFPEEERPVDCFMEDYHRDGLESEAGSSDPVPMFRGVGEKLYLWKILEKENPWGISNIKLRNAKWDEAAEKVMKPGYVDISDKHGKRTVKVDVCKGMHISVDAMLKKMKALWQSSKAVVAREEGRAPAKTREGTMSAAEACADGGESERRQLEKTIRLCEVYTAARQFTPLKPTASKELAKAAAAAATATQKQVLQRVLSAGAVFMAASGRSGARGGRSGTRGGRSGTRGGRATRGGRGAAATRYQAVERVPSAGVSAGGGHSTDPGSSEDGKRSGTGGGRGSRGSRGGRGSRGSRGGRGVWLSVQGARRGGEVAGRGIQGAEGGDRVAGRGGRGGGRTVQGAGRGGRGRGHGRGSGGSSGKKRSRDSTDHAGGEEIPSLEEEAETSGEDGEDGHGAGRGVRAGGRGGRENKRDAKKRSRGPTNHAHGAEVSSEAESLEGDEEGEEEEEEEEKEEQEEEKEEEEEAQEEQEEEDPSSEDDASVAEGKDERAQALSGGTLSTSGAQVAQGAVGRKRQAPHSFKEGMDAASIAALVDTCVKEMLGQDDGFGAALQQQVNERLDQMAAEQRRTLDGIVEQQNIMSSHLASLFNAFSQNAAAAGAAPLPPPPSPTSSSDYSTPLPCTIADMASLPWLGCQADVVPPCTGMGLGGVAGPYRGASGIAVGFQSGGPYLSGVENAGSTVEAAGIASDVTQKQQLGATVGVAGVENDTGQEQQGTAAVGVADVGNDKGQEQQEEGGSARGGEDAEGLQADTYNVSGGGNAGEAWELPVSQERRDDGDTAGSAEEAGGKEGEGEGMEEEEKEEGVEVETGLGEVEGQSGPSESVTLRNALCGR